MVSVKIEKKDSEKALNLLIKNKRHFREVKKNVFLLPHEFDLILKEFDEKNINYREVKLL